MTTVPIYITWLNHLGGFEYFFFTAKKAKLKEIISTGVTKNNILPNWPKSYGKTADTINKQTFRDTVDKMVIKSQHLTRNQLDALVTIKDSVLVQEVISRTDRRTLIVDTDSFQIYDETDKLFTFQFTATYTDNNPSQRL